MAKFTVRLRKLDEGIGKQSPVTCAAAQARTDERLEPRYHYGDRQFTSARAPVVGSQLVFEVDVPDALRYRWPSITSRPSTQANSRHSDRRTPVMETIASRSAGSSRLRHENALLVLHIARGDGVGAGASRTTICGRGFDRPESRTRTRPASTRARCSRRSGLAVGHLSVAGAAFLRCACSKRIEAVGL